MNNRLDRTLEKAIGLMRQRRFAEAKPLVAQLSRKAPKHPLAWNLLGVIASEEEDYDRAIACFRMATSLAPRDADFHNNLGEACRKAGRYEDAAPCFQAALKLQPAHAAAHNNLGAALNALHREEEAAVHLAKAVHLRPDNYEAYTNLGIALLNQRKPREAIPCFERAAQLNSRDPVLLGRLGSALEHIDRFEDALELFRKATEMGGDKTDNMVAQVANLERQGRIDEAWEILEQLLTKAPEHPGVALQFANLARKVDRREDARLVLKRVASQDSLTDEARQSIYFALGDLNDSLDDYDAAFEAYARGNALAARPYDYAKDVADQDATESVYRPGWRERLAVSSNPSVVPIFIVGMPRSGTTLTEQILACHPAMHGAGELMRIPDIAKAMATETGASGFPACMEQVTAETLDRFAAEHLSFLEQIGENANRVIDKLPHNHRYLGLIEQLFPNARVIHCTRDPLDTCLSCYFQNFYGGHGYSNDLRLLGAHFRLYERAMAHWRQVCSLPVLEVAYETLVEDQETVSREMVAFLGLDWDDACLKFHESGRRALTASYDQVRQPIYRRSVSRHQHYEQHLAPLREALAKSGAANAA